MNKAFYGKFTLGVLGGGQLGRMLIQEAINLNIDIAVLDGDAHAPCKDLATRFVLGKLMDFDAVYNFGKTVDLLTIEIEHVNIEALEKLEAEGLKVFPQPAILRMVQDKGLQKEFYKNNRIPTADFHLVKTAADIQHYVSEFPFMQKLRKGGYDGKGVTALRVESDIKAKSFDAPSVLEKMVAFEKEIAVIVARNEQGECVAFPAVEMDFNPEVNLVEFLRSPANVSNVVAENAKKIAIQIAENTGIIGILAVELFLLKNGEILVNEIAPRPHNSGHQTIEGNITSQYAQHLRAILNLPLGNTDITSPSVMINLLGEEGFEGDAKYEGLAEAMAMRGVNVHLYGKKTTKSFRKMGHVTVLANSPEDAIYLANKVKSTLKVWA